MKNNHYLISKYFTIFCFNGNNYIYHNSTCTLFLSAYRGS